MRTLIQTETDGPVTYRLYIHPEDIEVRGNVLASGDDEQDRAAEDEILARLDNGDMWAWFMAECVAEAGGVTSRATLGGCSYSGKDNFLADGYWPSMKADALDNLRAKLTEAKAAAISLSL